MTHFHFRQLALVLASLSILCFTSSLFAVDEVTQKSVTKKAIGEITNLSRTELTINQKTGGILKIPANDIASIKWDGEPPKLGIARGDEERGVLEKALETYVEVHKESSGKMKTYLDFLISRTMAKLALDDPARVDDAVKKLEAFTKANADHIGYFESMSYLGQVQALKGDFAKAQTAFEGLGKAPWKDFQMASKIATGRMQLKQNNVDGALKTFDDITAGKAETDSEKSRQAEAQVGKAACLVKQSKHDDALKLIDEIIKSTSVDEKRAMSEAYVLQGDCYQAQNKPKEAVLAYLHVPVLFENEKAAHAEALFNLAKLSGTIGQAERAAEARADLLERFPNSEWAKKLQEPAAAPAPAATNN